MIIAIIGLSLLSSVCYRLGGTNKGTLWRDFGVPVVVSLTMLILGIRAPWWAYLAHFGLLYGALTSYRYFLPKPVDYTGYHYGLHGLFCGLSALIFWQSIPIWIILLRSIVLAGFMFGWYFVAKWSDNLHEGGRGAAITATLPLLLI